MAFSFSVLNSADTAPFDLLEAFSGPGHPPVMSPAFPAYQQFRQRIFGAVFPSAFCVLQQFAFTPATPAYYIPTGFLRAVEYLRGDVISKNSAGDEIKLFSEIPLSSFSMSGRIIRISSVGVQNTYISIQIAQIISQIELLEQQIKELDSAITEVMESLNSVIMTVPGIGAVNGACILGEIGDVNRFSKPCKLLAYAGLDPTVRQSGQFSARSTRMSKRGSALLRYALINAAWQLTLNDPTFKAYYDLKLSQGLNHYGALGHVAHKLVRVLFKLLRDNVAFKPAEILI